MSNFIIKGPAVLQVLKNLYKSWKDIDLYLAALMEKVPNDAHGQRNQVMFDLLKFLGSLRSPSFFLGNRQDSCHNYSQSICKVEEGR